MKKLFILLFVNLLTFFTTKAQTAKVPIQTDRPDQTESPSTVPAKFWQVEAGFMYESDKIGDITNGYVVSPTILTKYGLTKNFEFRLITEIANSFSRVRSRNATGVTGLNPVVVGFKANILREKKWIPKTSFIGHLGLSALASADFRPRNTYPQFRFLMQHTIDKKTNFGYNLGAEWYGNSAVMSAIYTVTLARDLGNGFGGFVEFYGYFPERQRADHRFDAGLTYLAKRNLQFDVSGGVGLNEWSPDYFISAGVSFRSPR